MIIDTTTKNKVYNPTSAQGQWFQHRWGRRDYPDIELSWEKFQEVIQDVTDTIYLVCTYGDPAEWPHLSKASDLLKDQLHVVTYGMLSDSDVECLLKNETKVTFLLDRTSKAPQVFLNTDWNIISKNIKTLNKNVFIEYVTYQHNLSDLPELVKLAQRYNIQVKLNTGLSTDGNITCIVSDKCEWLFDAVPFYTNTDFLRFSELSEHVNSIDTSVSAVEKTINGYNTLRTYYKIQHHRNIFESPLITREELPADIIKRLDVDSEIINLISVSPTGHVFKNDMMFSMFMRLLGRDWLLSRTHVKQHADNQYMKEVIYYARKILNLGLTC